MNNGVKSSAFHVLHNQQTCKKLNETEVDFNGLHFSKCNMIYPYVYSRAELSNERLKLF